MNIQIIDAVEAMMGESDNNGRKLSASEAGNDPEFNSVLELLIMNRWLFTRDSRAITRIARNYVIAESRSQSRAGDFINYTPGFIYCLFLAARQRSQRRDWRPIGNNG